MATSIPRLLTYLVMVFAAFQLAGFINNVEVWPLNPEYEYYEYDDLQVSGGFDGVCTLKSVKNILSAKVISSMAFVFSVGKYKT